MGASWGLLAPWRPGSLFWVPQLIFSGKGLLEVSWGRLLASESSLGGYLGDLVGHRRQCGVNVPHFRPHNFDGICGAIGA